MPLAFIAYRHAWASAHVPGLIFQAEWEKGHWVRLVSSVYKGSFCFLVKGASEAKVAKGQWHPSSGGTLGGPFLPGDLSQALDGSVPAFLLIHRALFSQMLSPEKSVWDGNALHQWKFPSRVYPCLWDLGHPPTLGTVERLSSKTFLSCFLCILFEEWQAVPEKGVYSMRSHWEEGQKMRGLPKSICRLPIRSLVLV